MSNMKRWLREHGISYAQLAKQLNQSQPSISQKVNLKTCWQFDDCRRLRDVYGLSSDFVQDLVPYEAKFAESVAYRNKTAHPRPESFIPDALRKGEKATTPEPDDSVAPAYGTGIDWNEFHTTTRYPNTTD